MTDPGEEPMLDVARGDAALSRQLRDSLRILQARSEDERFRRLVDDVLNGRAGLREASRTDTFAAGINDGVREFARRWECLSNDERAELAEQGRQSAETENDLRQRYGR
jgi:hypothetical protein